MKTEMRDRLQVLLIEDDEDDYLITRDLLSEMEGTKFSLEWVSDYDAGLQAMERNRHDVYLVDYHLGERTGLELLREALGKGCKAPVILLTGQGDRETDLEAMAVGAADYLVKGRIDAPLLERALRYSIEHAKMLARLHELATYDELTGLYNRREMFRLLKDEIDRCRRYDHPISLIILDVDHFKSVNDTYGHQVGDGVLRWVAQQVARHTRSAHQAARYGGEELAVILPQTTGQQAFEVAERLRSAVAAQPYLYARQNRRPLTIPVTVSLGVAALQSHAGSEEILVLAADRALYEAKRKGRNRSVLLSSEALKTRPLLED